MFKSVLVPLDGTTFAEHALPLAATIASHAGATLRLLTVLPPLADRYFWAPLPGSQLDRDLHEHYKMEGRKYLETVAQCVRGDVAIVCDMLDERIDIPEAIEREVARAGVDLVVMPSHGRGTLKRFWLGSIADDVYRSSSVPVLLARPQEKRVDFEHESQVRHIIVALDGSAQAEEVLDAALNVGQAMNAELHLVRVIARTQSPPANGQSDKASVGEAIDDHLRQDPGRYLQTIADKLRARGARVQTRLLVYTEPAEAILEAAAGADLIAIQTHARRGVSRLVHGSVVDKVVHNSTVPVLINRPHHK
jgi:nucleotide-binding universal stress UspA family protein